MMTFRMSTTRSSSHPSGNADSWLVFPERRGAAPLVHREGAVLEFAGPLVAVDYDAGGRRLGIRKPEGPGGGPVAEEALARANHDRKDPQTELGDEVMLQQRLDQVRAPVHLNLASGLLLEPRDGRCGIPGQQGGVVPIHFAKRPRGDVLSHAI